MMDMILRKLYLLLNFFSITDIDIIHEVAHFGIKSFLIKVESIELKTRTFDCVDETCLFSDLRSCDS